MCHQKYSQVGHRSLLSQNTLNSGMEAQFTLVISPGEIGIQLIKVHLAWYSLISLIYSVHPVCTPRKQKVLQRL